jgi:hypothetical protein
MTTYKAPLADIRFVMFDLLKVEAAYQRLPGGEKCDARCRRCDPRGGGAVFRAGAGAAQRER